MANSKAFEKPVFNYSRDFDFVWDEIVLPIRYGTDLRLAEHIVLDAARAATADLARDAVEQLARLERKHLLGAVELEPRVYLRLTESWIELSLRFIARPSGVREMKDRMSRRVLSGLQGAGIEIASATVEVVGLPTLPVRLEGVPPDEEEEAKPSDFQ